MRCLKEEENVAYWVCEMSVRGRREMVKKIKLASLEQRHSENAAGQASVLRLKPSAASLHSLPQP